MMLIIIASYQLKKTNLKISFSVVKPSQSYIGGYPAKSSVSCQTKKCDKFVSGEKCHGRMKDAKATNPVRSL